MKQKIILIGNPIAGGNAAKKISRAVKIIEKRGFDVKLMLTEKKGDAERFAKEFSTKSGILVIAAGGDGTYNEVINGIAGTDIPMAILPLGTTNVLASELNIPSNLEKAIDIALDGKLHTIHIGKITCQEFGSPEADQSLGLSVTHRSSLVTRYFLLMAGFGFDGEVVLGISEKIKRYSGKGAYILSGLKTILRYNPSRITLKITCQTQDSELRPASGGQNSELIGYTAIISKVSCYGGNFRITPDAKLTEPYLYVFMIHKKGRFNLLRYIFRILRGNHLRLKDISYFKASEIAIEGNAHIQIDGDYFGMTPAKVGIVSDALKLIF